MASDMEKNEKGEIMVLKHDTLPGYLPVYYAVFALGIVYLGIVFYLG